MKYRVSLNVSDLDPEQLPRVMETVNRVATGLALDGLHLFVAIHPEDDEEDEDDLALRVPDSGANADD